MGILYITLKGRGGRGTRNKLDLDVGVKECPAKIVTPLLTHVRPTLRLRQSHDQGMYERD